MKASWRDLSPTSKTMAVIENRSVEAGEMSQQLLSLLTALRGLSSQPVTGGAFAGTYVEYTHAHTHTHTHTHTHVHENKN